MSKTVDVINDWFKHTVGRGLYEYQSRVLNRLEKGENIIINKSRQMGLSTALGGYALTKALQGKSVVIVSPSLTQSTNVMYYIKRFLATLRQVSEVPADQETMTALLFPNGGSVRCVPNSPSTVRGFAVPNGIIIFDEWAHFRNNTDKEIIQAVLPMIARGGQVIYNSTPFGERGDYYERWQSKQGKLTKIMLNWRECPDIDGDKLKEELHYDSITWEQEFENKFIGEVDSFFPYAILDPCIDNDLELAEI